MVYSGANEPVDIVVNITKSYSGKTMVLVLLVLLAVSLIFLIKKSLYESEKLQLNVYGLLFSLVQLNKKQVIYGTSILCVSL